MLPNARYFDYSLSLKKFIHKTVATAVEKVQFQLDFTAGIVLQRNHGRHGFQSAWSRPSRYLGKVAPPRIEPGSVDS